MELDKYAQKLKDKLTDRNFDGSRLPIPINKTAFPSTSSQLFLEIGCGAGLHPILFAQDNPESHLLAFERTKEKFEKFSGRVKSHELKNITAIHDDALHWLYSQLKNESEVFEGLYLLYPNPYPKNTHRNKRFFASPSFQFILSTIKKEGLIELRTNEQWYIEEAQYLAKEVWNLKEISLKEVSTLHPSKQGLTHFERKYLKNNQACYQLIFKA